MSIALLVGSILGVLGLAAAAYWLGLGGGGLTEEEEAKRIAEEALPGFEAGDAILSADGRAAIVLGASGEAALLKLHGVHPAVRRLGSIAVEKVPGGVRIDSGERMFGSVTLRLSPEDRDKLLTLL